MTIKRMITQLKFWLFLRNGQKRAEYAKKRDLFAEIGENSYLPTYVPLYPQMVKIHNNVIMHRSVQLVTHDFLNGYLERMDLPNKCHFKNKENLCPIEIMDNVYIGMDSIILGNVRIGPNAIINAGSLVASDVPPNSVVGGVPARVIGSFDKYVKLRVMMDKSFPYTFQRSGREAINQETAEMAWERFDKQKNKRKQEGNNNAE